MLLVDVHELDIVLADPVAARILKDEVDDVRRVLRLQGQNVIGLCGTEHLGEGCEIDTEGDVAVASEGGEAFGSQQHGDESNVGVVHGLESDAGVIAVEVAVLDKVLDSVDELCFR